MPGFGRVLTRTQLLFVWSEFMLPVSKECFTSLPRTLRCVMILSASRFFSPGVYAPNMSIATLHALETVSLIIIIQTSVANVHSKSQSSTSSLRHILLFHSLPLCSQVYSLRQYFHHCDRDSSSLLALMHI